MTLKSRWGDGTTHLVFEPVEFLEKLAALVPRPRLNLVIYPTGYWPRTRAGGLGSSRTGRRLMRVTR